jgi:phospholipid transport system substrate-binding protein
MQIKTSLLTISFVLLLAFLNLSAESVDISSNSPMDKIKYIDKLLEGYAAKHKGQTLTAAQQQKNLSIKHEIVYKHFDMGELCRLSMDKHWKPLSPAQRKEFVDVFTKLIVQNAVLASEKYTGEQVVNYLKQQYINKDKTRARVVTSVYVEDEDVDVTVTYLLIKTPTGWRIYDIIMDDVSLMENYKQQFDRIITSSSYQNLLAKMRKKLATGSQEL